MTITQPILAVPRAGVVWHRRLLSLPNAVTFCYMALAGALVTRHAIWRDQAQDAGLLTFFYSKYYGNCHGDVASARK